MPGGGKRGKSLEERLRVVRETENDAVTPAGAETAGAELPALDAVFSEDAPVYEAVLDETPAFEVSDETVSDERVSDEPISAGTVSDERVSDEPISAGTVSDETVTERVFGEEMFFPGDGSTTSDHAIAATPTVAEAATRGEPANEARVSSLHDELREFAGAMGEPARQAPNRATDHELAEVHDQLEALRTAASEGDTFLPAGATAAPAIPEPGAPRRLRFSQRGAPAPTSEPVPVSAPEPEPVAAPVFARTNKTPAVPAEQPVTVAGAAEEKRELKIATSFLDRFRSHPVVESQGVESQVVAPQLVESQGVEHAPAVARGRTVAIASPPPIPFESPDVPDPVESSATGEPVARDERRARGPEPVRSEWEMPAGGGGFGRIGTALIARGLITSAQLDAALELQRSTGKRIGDSLVDMGVISPFELVRVLADHMGVPFTDLRSKPPDPILATLLPEDVARRYDALPVARWNDQLVIAMANPTDLFALDDLQLVTRQSIIPAMALLDDLRTAINRVYQVSQVETTLDAAAGDYEPAHDSAASGITDVDEGPVVRLVNTLLDQAISDNASDLHVEPCSTHIAVRYRIDGVLHDSSEVPLTLLRPLVSRLKILANLDIAQARLAQDGRFSVSLHGRPVDVRVVTVPTAAGEAVILRLLDPTRDAFDSSNLRLTPEEQARFLPAFRASQGAAFVTGPTGSGKTSTIYGVLSEINTRSKSIISIEDPVEYRLDGVKQMQLNTRVGLTFANTLPSVLRSDPDVVFIGEVRDMETARIAADAAITGHLVLSTLHATRAAAAPMRLVDMGVEPYLVASALTLVAAQRLARQLCDACAEPVGPAGQTMLRDLGAGEQVLEGANVRRAVGCPACRGTGFRGRVPVFEIMPVTDGISRLILDRASRADLEALAVEEGMDTLKIAALRRVATGVLSIDEMMRVVS